VLRQGPHNIAKKRFYFQHMPRRDSIYKPWPRRDFMYAICIYTHCRTWPRTDLASLCTPRLWQFRYFSRCVKSTIQSKVPATSSVSQCAGGWRALPTCVHYQVEKFVNAMSFVFVARHTTLQAILSPCSRKSMSSCRMRCSRTAFTCSTRTWTHSANAVTQNDLRLTEGQPHIAPQTLKRGGRRPTSHCLARALVHAASRLPVRSSRGFRVQGLGFRV
jgi:hypothetical protein